MIIAELHTLSPQNNALSKTVVPCHNQKYQSIAHPFSKTSHGSTNHDATQRTTNESVLFSFNRESRRGDPKRIARGILNETRFKSSFIAVKADKQTPLFLLSRVCWHLATMSTTSPTQETDTTKEKTVSIEMVPASTADVPKEEDEAPYTEGDMFGWRRRMKCSRYDPKARARAANMTSYVAMTVNILLTVAKVIPLLTYQR